jgi:hypothetical protein
MQPAKYFHVHYINAMTSVCGRFDGPSFADQVAQAQRNEVKHPGPPS